MAKIDLKLPEGYERRLTELGNRMDAVAEIMLKAGAEVVLAKLKSSLESVIGVDTKYKSRSTGELVGALGISPVKQDYYGIHNIKIGFDEPHSGDVANAMLGNLIEYGKTGQPAKPFLKPAKAASRAPAIAAMKEAFEREVRK